MDASEWRYVGEGGKHALFAYDPDKISGERWRGRLLRIAKKDFHCVAAEQSLSESDDPLYYLRNVVAPSLDPYVDIPDIIELDCFFLKKLRQITLLDGRIPTSREGDWSLLPSSTPHHYTGTIRGLLVQDYRLLSVTDPISDKLMQDRRISIEIKPKAGYIAFSPLVHPLHRVKYQQSRFSLLQKLHQQGHVDKGWTKSLHRVKMSEYDPIDLFSNETTRMRKAIASLFSCPQNNLRIWYNDSQLIGHGYDVAESRMLSKEIFENMFELAVPKSLERQLESTLGGIILSILYHETLLQKLLKMQQLDILDSDGAILVYQRLVEFCNGSHKTAETLLDSLDSLKTIGDERECVLKNSPFVMCSPDTLNVKFLYSEIAEFREKIRSTPTLPPTCELDECRAKVQRIIESLSVEECRFFLLNWLFSLAMCDVSIFLTFQRIRREKEVPNTACCSSHRAQVLVPNITVLKGATAGLGQFSCTVNKKTVHFAYNIRLVDCDKKPASKLRKRQEFEQVFRHLA